MTNKPCVGSHPTLTTIVVQSGASHRQANFPADGTWHEWTDDYDIKADNVQILIDLPEYEAQVFVKS